jgi:hypothetical protein
MSDPPYHLKTFRLTLTEAVFNALRERLEREDQETASQEE